MTSDVTQEVYIIQVAQPFSVVDQHGIFTKVQEAFELRKHAFNVGLQLLFCKHFADLCFTAGVADHGRTPTHQGDYSVTSPLHMCESHQRNQVSNMH